jgi:predicted phage-related endonuclease
MLTPEQLLERRKGIGASDAKAIMSGDWVALWQDKMGLAEPKEILSPWDAAVRHALEPLVLDDYEARNDRALTRRGEAVVSADYPILRCTLDGFDPQMGPVDAKALNIWTPGDPEQWCIEMYTGQMQHQMFVMGSSRGALHVSLGMKRPTSIFFERDDFFLNEYIEKCREFWRYVETKTPPPGGAEAMMEPAPPEKMRTVDMTGNNSWSAAAADWLSTVSAAKTFKRSEASLKEMVEADVKEAGGHGIVIKRSKAGSLSIKAAS